MKRRPPTKALLRKIKMVKDQFTTWRKEIGITQMQLANATNISQQVISTWENYDKQAVPDLAQWMLIMEVAPKILEKRYAVE